MRRRLRTKFHFMLLRRPHTQYEVNRRQQKMWPVGLDHERINRLQSVGRQFHMVGQHDNRYVRPDVLDLVGDGRAIQQAEVVFEDNRIHRLRHEKTQAIATVGRSGQLVSVFLQQLKLGRIPVYAQQRIGRQTMSMLLKLRKSAAS